MVQKRAELRSPLALHGKKSQRRRHFQIFWGLSYVRVEVSVGHRHGLSTLNTTFEVLCCTIADTVNYRTAQHSSTGVIQSFTVLHDLQLARTVKSQNGTFISFRIGPICLLVNASFFSSLVLRLDRGTIPPPRHNPWVTRTGLCTHGNRIEY